MIMPRLGGAFFGAYMIIKRNSILYKLLNALPYRFCFYQVWNVRVGNDLTSYAKITFGFPSY